MTYFCGVTAEMFSMPNERREIKAQRSKCELVLEDLAEKQQIPNEDIVLTINRQP